MLFNNKQIIGKQAIRRGMVQIKIKFICSLSFFKSSLRVLLDLKINESNIPLDLWKRKN